MHKAELHSSVTNLRLGRRQQTKVAMKLGGLDGTWMDAWWDDMGCLMMPGMPSLTQCFFFFAGHGPLGIFLGVGIESGDTWRYRMDPYGSVWIRMVGGKLVKVSFPVMLQTCCRREPTVAQGCEYQTWRQDASHGEDGLGTPGQRPKVTRCDGGYMRIPDTIGSLNF